MSKKLIHKGLAGQVLGGLRRGGGASIGFRMTAMIDVVFLLLTFFVLTSKFQKPLETINVVLPRPQISEGAAKEAGAMVVRLKSYAEGCQVVIERGGQCDLLKKDIDKGLSQITQNFQTASKFHDIETYGLELYCEDDVQWDYLVKIYDLLYRLGAKKISIVHNK